ncbi:MAG TPA: undecaprenyldiphospho-muramoylpentapeptide beta-N-acetylglucosaminyltransferase [Polyangiales bacterium]|jgi:UDP-N-acetylglucosamine--N-acetylmuramyl-(pentapeptide) pyrophosphoryl-undecaprenol N-acetylglucosamine transferase|nr:undecaprenyldiphospho-muramoylpentapeptide beta-N-acetylglucosaminyltransferase [Polyangiales bacterium]
MIQRIMVAGGGTGGHLFPGLAVVDELRRRLPEIEVRFVGTARGIESRILPRRGESLELLEVTPLKGQGLGARFKSFARIPTAMKKASALMDDFEPDLVLGVGGYASGPVLLSASLSGRPTALLEQNAQVGMTNRILARFVDRAYISFEQTEEVFGRRKSRLTGNPVRQEFVEHARLALADPEGFESRARTILVLGGSQGARKLNEDVPRALAKAGIAARRLEVVHQTGESMRDQVEAAYQELGIQARVVTFIDEIARAYSNAALVIARAGATTLAELCAIGRPSILVPFPFAADDHQTKNAQALEEQHASICLREADLEVDALGATIADLLDDPVRRQAMAQAARDHGRPDAAAAIVDDMMAWVGGADPLGAEAAQPEREPPAGLQYSGLAMAPILRLGCPEVALRPASHRPRRPVVVDGALWE